MQPSYGHSAHIVTIYIQGPFITTVIKYVITVRAMSALEDTFPVVLTTFGNTLHQNPKVNILVNIE